MILTFSVVSCRENKEETAQPMPTSNPPMTAMAAEHSGVIQEVLQANQYTYLNVEEDAEQVWIAVRKGDFKVGQTISFSGGLEMRDFPSKDLNRTFERVLFVSELGGAPSGAAPHGMPPMPHAMPSSTSPTMGRPTVAKQDVSVEPLVGGITIGKLFGNRDAYADKTVKIKGKVTKVNRGIMGKNWIHLQDGTSSGEEYDLTLTTQDDANMGDIVAFEGKITLKKDFGAGYAYDVIMEEAKRIDH